MQKEDTNPRDKALQILLECVESHELETEEINKLISLTWLIKKHYFLYHFE